MHCNRNAIEIHELVTMQYGKYVFSILIFIMHNRIQLMKVINILKSLSLDKRLAAFSVGFIFYFNADFLLSNTDVKRLISCEIKLTLKFKGGFLSCVHVQLSIIHLMP